MYRGFKLQLNKPFADEYFNVGRSVYADQKSSIEKNVKNLVVDHGVIDGTSIQNDWFPAVDADIFLSHSHADERLATCLAGWLYKEFKLKCFIDSHVWGFSKLLVEMLDNKYSVIGDSLYDYNSVITSASHVHSMLLMAIASMIDKSECLFFLNTPRSLSTKQRGHGAAENTTASPWIYAELSISQTIRKKSKEEHRNEIALESLWESVVKSHAIEYTAPTGHLLDISLTNLNMWSLKKDKETHPLDILYQNNPER